LFRHNCCCWSCCCCCYCCFCCHCCNHRKIEDNELVATVAAAEAASIAASVLEDEQSRTLNIRYLFVLENQPCTGWCHCIHFSHALIVALKVCRSIIFQDLHSSSNSHAILQHLPFSKELMAALQPQTLIKKYFWT